MDYGENKYNRLLAILRKSKPALLTPERTMDAVMNRILKEQAGKKASPRFLEFIFGWVYIGWVRTSLVAASVILVLAFVYQQAVILKRINNLNRQAVFIESQIITSYANVPNAAVLYQIAGRKFTPGGRSITEKQIRQILRSYRDLEEKFNDLMKLIEGDPALKKYVEEQLSENSKEKLKL